jgi:hypothetical protein
MEEALEIAEAVGPSASADAPGPTSGAEPADAVLVVPNVADVADILTLVLWLVVPGQAKWSRSA